MHHDKTIFSTYHKLKHRLFVGGIKSGLKAVGIGTVPIMDQNNNVRVLENVLHIPDMKNGLMSLTQLAEKDWEITLNKGGCTATHKDFSIHSPITKGLCWWVQTPSAEAEAFFASIAIPKEPTVSKSKKPKASLKDWHERFAHVSKNAIIKFCPKAMADLDLNDVEITEDDKHQCESCAHGKQHRLPFPPVLTRKSKPLELVHSDLAECHITSLGGGKYVVGFTDDATRHHRAYILPNKQPQTVLRAFKEYQAWAERQTGYKIKELRTDRGGEFLGDMIDYVESVGIEHKPTAGFSPQSNGVAERMNRTLFEMVCCMLDHAGAPLELWSEALHHATYIRNRLPTSSLNGMSPHEAWTGRKPHVKHIRKWTLTRPFFTVFFRRLFTWSKPKVSKSLAKRTGSTSSTKRFTD